MGWWEQGNCALVFLLEHWHFCQTGAFWSFLFNSIHTWRICLFSCILHTSGLWRRGIHCRCSSLQSLRGQFFFIHCTPFFPSLLEKNDQCDNFYRQIEQTPQTHTHTHTHLTDFIIRRSSSSSIFLLVSCWFWNTETLSLLLWDGRKKDTGNKRRRHPSLSLTHTLANKHRRRYGYIYDGMLGRTMTPFIYEHIHT